MTNVEKKKQLPAFLVLTIISLVAAVVLAATNAVTKGPIAEHARKAREEAFQAVLPADAYDDPAEGSNVYVARKAGDKVDVISGSTMTSNGVIDALNQILPVAELPAAATPLTASAPGFVMGDMGGDVGVSVTLNEDGSIATLTVDTATQTPSIGDKCADEAWLAQFIGKKGPFSPDAGPVGYCVVTSAQGYGGPVAVTLGVDMDGVVTGAKIGDNNFAETPGFGMKWKEDADRAEQFKGISLAEGGMIEGVTGATVTSNAVLKAANEGLAEVGALMGIERTEPVLKMGKKEVAYADSVAAGDYTVTGKGYQSEVKVTFTVDENSTITALTIDSTGETPNFGTRCTTDTSYAESFIGKKVPIKYNKDVDALSGATITSEAIVDAINSVAAAGDAAADDTPAVTEPEKTPEANDEEPSVEASADPVAPAGPLTATAPGYEGQEVGVTVTLNEDGTIATIEFDLSKQAPPLCNNVNTDEFKANFIGKKGPFEGIDVVSEATYTSNGIIEALNSLFAEASATETLTATAPGFVMGDMGGDVTVNVTLNEDSTIATLSVDVSNQTPGIGDKCADEAWLGQFIGKKGPFVAGENGIDVITNSTMTSTGIINALNSLFPAEETVTEEPAVEAPATETLTATAPGFVMGDMGGDVTVNVTLNEDSTIATLSVDVSNQTPGIGDKCADEAWLGQFIGKKGPFVAGENGIDVITNSTMTSTGIINALNSLFPAEETPAGEEKTGKAQGFQSEVVVTLTVADDVITAIKVDSSNETPGLGTRCGEDEAFLAQFVGKKATPDLGEGIDALTGATVTSNAVIAAANAAIGVETGVVEIPSVEAEPVVDATTEATAGATASPDPVETVPVMEEPVEAPAAVTITKPAFAGQDVIVTVTFAEDGTIAALTVDASTQSAGLGLKCGEERFISQFIGMAAPLTIEDIDVVSYATITCQAVVDAVNEAAAGVPTQDMSATNEEGPVAPNAATITKPAFAGQDVIVTVTFAEDGTIAALTVDASTQSAGLGLKCGEERFTSQFIGKAAPLTIEDIDVVSYATITCQAVVDAVNEAAAQ